MRTATEKTADPPSPEGVFPPGGLTAALRALPRFEPFALILFALLNSHGSEVHLGDNELI